MPSVPTQIFSRLGDDPELRELVELFVADLPVRAANLKAAFACDRSQLRRIVHQMKGAAGSYGFPQLSVAAASLEQSLCEDQAEELIRRELDELIDLCFRARCSTRGES